MTWKDWPARRMPGRAALAVAVIVCTVFGMTSMGWLYGLLAALVLLRGSAEVLFPTRYTLSEDGLSITNPLRIVRAPWSRYRDWRPTGDGVLLRGRSSISWLAQRRTVALSAPDRDALQSTVAQWLEPKETEVAP